MDNKDFKPYIPAEKITPEITITSIVMGVLLAVIFGAANAYLGLRVGMTVSASIPAAVIAMGVIRVIMRKNSILESNIVQTIGSAGESLAAGAIFTLPALFLWAAEGKVDKPGLWEITAIALIGGLLGVFFMVPLRNALIVKEHGVLPYPEGTACSEVLLAGDVYKRQPHHKEPPCFRWGRRKAVCSGGAGQFRVGALSLIHIYPSSPPLPRRRRKPR